MGKWVAGLKRWFYGTYSNSEEHGLLDFVPPYLKGPPYLSHKTKRSKRSVDAKNKELGVRETISRLNTAEAGDFIFLPYIE